MNPPQFQYDRGKNSAENSVGKISSYLIDRGYVRFSTNSPQKQDLICDSEKPKYQYCFHKPPYEKNRQNSVLVVITVLNPDSVGVNLLDLKSPDGDSEMGSLSHGIRSQFQDPPKPESVASP
jgi:hypothetical protein